MMYSLLILSDILMRNPQRMIAYVTICVTALYGYATVPVVRTGAVQVYRM